MAHVKNHDYQILPPSIWPLLGAIGEVLVERLRAAGHTYEVTPA